MNPYAALPGPDFIEAVAETELHNGNEINAAEFRRRAREWQDDQLRITQLQHENRELQERLQRITHLAKAA